MQDRRDFLKTGFSIAAAGLAGAAALTGARRSVSRTCATLLALDRPALLLNPGLLARYDLMPMLSELAQASGTRDGPPSLWLLVPQPDAGMPRIDDAPLPVMSATNWARLTDPWLANAHRAGGAQSAA
jgi:hypothetical protein